MQLKDKISVVCPKCNRVNIIPSRYFYDGYEGPFFCKFCGCILDIDVDYE